MFRFMSLGSDHASLTEVSNLFINLLTASLVWSSNALRSTEKHIVLFARILPAI